ncbi:MAG: hypothetical protein AAF333_04105 [Planctomycetota bacterium]
MFDRPRDPDPRTAPSSSAAPKTLPQGCKFCPTCGAKLVEYRHRLNRGLVTVLRRLHEAGGIAKLSDLGLTNSQWDNAQKLSYFELMVKHFRDGKRVGGTWEITELGRHFLAGEATVPGVAVTFRGERVRFEGKTVGVREVEGVAGYRQRRDYAGDATPVTGSEAGGEPPSEGGGRA